MNQSEPELPQLVALPARVRHIGHDREGDDHYLLPDECVFVVHHGVDGDELIHEQPLGERPLWTWVNYVADRRGWTCCKYDDRPYAEWLLKPRVPQEAGR